MTLGAYVLVMISYTPIYSNHRDAELHSRVSMFNKSTFTQEKVIEPSIECLVETCFVSGPLIKMSNKVKQGLFSGVQ